tara:strand:- start:197 stop:451 length:255 start_codon:yes stop_codon:yes gene_type:complete
MKKILSKSSYFLIFSGFVSWLLFGSNLYEKLVNINEKYHIECQEVLENIKLSKDLILNEVDKCKKRKFRERGFYKKYVKWILNS